MTTGNMDYLTGILRRLVFRISELLEEDPTEGEEERAPTSAWAFDHVKNKHELDACHLHMTGPQIIPDDTFTWIEFDTAVFDKQDGLDPLNYKYVFKKEGIYSIGVRLGISLALKFYCSLRIYINDVMRWEWRRTFEANVAGNDMWSYMLWSASVGDEVKIRLYCLSTPPGNDVVVSSSYKYTGLFIGGILS